MQIPLGVANSVSSNFAYDPLDTVHYAEQSHFDVIQIYLNNELLGDNKRLDKIREVLDSGTFSTVYFHSEGYLNPEFTAGDYAARLFAFLDSLEESRVIIHYDEQAALEDTLQTIEEIAIHNRLIYLENYFRTAGRENAEKNLRKYQAIFTLANSNTVKLLPVLDIPRFFHQDLQLETSEALQWCYQMFNYFGNKRIPIVLHLIDSRDPQQDHKNFCTIGEGYIPYREILDFLKKTHPPLEGIVLEYEDKINPLKSRESLKKMVGVEHK